MNKISKVEIVCELILTLILLYIFRFNVYWRKYLLAYFVIETSTLQSISKKQVWL